MQEGIPRQWFVHAHVCTCCFLFLWKLIPAAHLFSIRHVMCQVVIKAQQIAVSSYIPNVDVRNGATCASDASTTNQFFVLLYTSRRRLSPSLPPASPCITPSPTPPRRCHPAAVPSPRRSLHRALVGLLVIAKPGQLEHVASLGFLLVIYNYKSNVDLMTLPHDSHDVDWS